VNETLSSFIIVIVSKNI